MVSLVGLFAPLPTPFTDDGSTISEVRLARAIRWMNHRGVEGFVVASETGQSTSLSLSERKMLLEIAMRESQGRPVISNVTTFSTQASLDLAQSAHRHGVRAVIVAPPPFALLSDNELFYHYNAICQHSGTNVIAVDPQGTFTPALMSKLSTIPMLYHANPILGHCGFYTGGTHSDSFALSEMIVSPIAAFAPWLLSPKISPFTLDAELIAAGTRRVVSEALELHGLEVGPLRGPYLSLNQGLTDKLRDFLQQFQKQVA